MQIHDFLTRFQIRQPLDELGYPEEIKSFVRKSAVLIPLVEINNELNILVCKRPDYLKHHPGQICFPGGKCENSDATPLDTALRETQEEMGFVVEKDQVIGEMKSYSTLTGFEIKPYIAFFQQKPHLNLQQQEVSTAFYIPLSQLIEKTNWRDIQFTRRNSNYTLKGFNTEYGLLWGATAQIIRNLINHLN